MVNVKKQISVIYVHKEGGVSPRLSLFSLSKTEKLKRPMGNLLDNR